MLVFGRKEKEVVFITVPPSPVEQRIGVCVIKATPGRTRLGFVCDRHIVVDRAGNEEKLVGKDA